MSSIFTRRLAAAQVNGSADVVLYTVPAGRTVVVRDVIIDPASNPAGTNVILFYLHGSLSVALVRSAVPTNQTYHLDLRQVLEPGDVLHMTHFGTSPMYVAVTGYVFE